MHDIEIVFHDDSTPSIVVGELKGDLCIRSMKNDTSHGVNVGSIGGEVIGDTVDSKAHNLLQQAVDVTKAPLIMVANKAKDGLNKLTKQNNGKILLTVLIYLLRNSKCSSPNMMRFNPCLCCLSL